MILLEIINVYKGIYKAKRAGNCLRYRKSLQMRLAVFAALES